MRPGAGDRWEDLPAELRSPQDPTPSGRWLRVLAAAIGAVAGGVAGAAVALVTCEELDCVTAPLGAVFAGAVLGGPIAFTLTLDIQRWRARRRSPR